MEFSGIAVLVVGDVMLDHYIAGKASRISPEAPVPVVNKERAWAVPGGAANVARGLARLGCNARLVGLAAMDAAGQTLRQELAAEGVDASLVAGARRPTICKTRILAGGQQLLRVDEESTARPTLEETVGMQLHINRLLPGSKAVILSDYAKGTLLRDKNGDSLAAYVIEQAHKLSIPVLVDPKGTDWEKYSGAQCITPNVPEFREIFGVLLPRLEAVPGNWHILAETLREKFGLERLLLTRGAEGMTLFEPDMQPWRIAAEKKEVADVSGAGDTVIATLAACKGLGLDWRQAAGIANIAAGVAVGKLGTSPVGADELNNVLGASESKIVSLQDLGEKIRSWREQGQSIVFTNGCFDLLHPGHISLLQQCGRLGDRVIVGLNSDSSVKRLKGQNRPVQSQSARAEILAALEAVDAVVIFEEDTPQNLIEIVKPDFLVKGSDYRADEVVGANFVKSYGGEVRLVKLINGFATTGLIRKIQGDGVCTQ